MKAKDIALGALTIIAGIFIYLLVEEINQSRKKDEKIISLKKQNRDLLMQSLKGKNQIPEEIKEQILKLINEYEGIEENVCNELLSVLALIEVGQEVKAIKDLAKIIENLLKNKYKNEAKFKGQKYIPLAKLIDHAKETKFLNPKEYSTAFILLDFRNEESHQLNVSDTKNMIIVALIGGIELIFRISRKGFFEGSKALTN